MSNTPNYLSRRQFLKAGTCGSMTIGPLVNSIAQLSLVNTASASVSYNHSDYKALVCIFLSGGADANNILIPRASHDLGEIYANERGIVGVANGVNSADVTLPLEGTDCGLHPSLTHMQSLYNNGNLAFVTNVGTLAEPTLKESYDSTTLPKQLFSHSDQSTEWMSSIADQPYTSGWGARVADLYNSVWNPSADTTNKTSMLITASGANRLQGGGSNNQYSITSSGAISLAGFGTNYSSAQTTALDGTVSYYNNLKGRRLKALEQIMQYSHAHIIEEGYSEVIRNARDNEELVALAMEAQTNSGVDFDTLWAGATGGIADELRIIATLIAGREKLGNNRQIFFVQMGGWDHHSLINSKLPSLLSELDSAIGAFDATMKELASKDANFSYDQVTTFNGSDFNRTFTPNKTSSDAGTDHAWGTHTFVMGGAVAGGTLYGEYPDLGVNSSVDVPSGSRGRWIPTTSVDQYSAVLANWFGVPEGSSEMETIFPNLNRFTSPFTEEANLRFFT